MFETVSHSHCAQLARANCDPLFPARFRTAAADFIVDETLSFALAGEGEHVYLQIRKTLLNTEEVAQQIARLAGVKLRDVSYAGLKDRNAITSQWFSIYLPGKQHELKQPDWNLLESDALQVIQHTRHQQKLRRGAIDTNRFEIVLREVGGEQQAVEHGLLRIKQQGVPNYFGEQRFGRGESNIQKARDMLSGKFKVKSRHQSGLYLSAARSLLFNLVLSHRVEHSCWNMAIAGDAMVLEGSHSFFVIDEVDDTILQRVLEFDIHPSGPLWGGGELAVKAEARDLETEILSAEKRLCEGLEKQGLKQQRRALRVLVPDLSYEWLEPDTLRMCFSLSSGSYATAVLRECFDLG